MAAALYQARADAGERTCLEIRVEAVAHDEYAAALAGKALRPQHGDGVLEHVCVARLAALAADVQPPRSQRVQQLAEHRTEHARPRCDPHGEGRSPKSKIRVRSEEQVGGWVCTSHAGARACNLHAATARALPFEPGRVQARARALARSLARSHAPRARARAYAAGGCLWRG